MKNEPAPDATAPGVVGDGCTLNTRALQAAIDAAAAKPTGGTVRLRAGVYRSGAVFLKSGVTLQLDAGATLLGSTNLADYPLIQTRVAGIEMPWPAALVNVLDAQDVTLAGSGCIDGDGAGFWAAYWARRAAYEPRGLRWAADYDCQRPRLVLVQNSQRVRVGGAAGAPLLLRRSAFWTLHLCYSQQVRVDRVHIHNNEGGRGPSTDGVDIDSCSRVLVRRVHLAVNDDAIVFKAGRDADGLRVARPTHDVLVADCSVSEGATGVAFGSETSGGFERVRVRRLLVGAAVPVGVLIKSARTRGGYLRQVRLTDLRFEGVAVPLRITLDWNPAYSRAVLPAAEVPHAPPHWQVLAAPVQQQQGLMQVQGVRVQRLHATCARTAFEVDADVQSPLRDFHFQHCHIQAQHGGHLLDVQRWSFENSHFALGQPVVLHNGAAVTGLPPAQQRVDKQHPRRNVSALALHQQDVS